MQFLRATLHKFVPAHFHDPFGLAFRLLRTGDPAARFAMGSALAGLALTPFDLVLSLAERRRTRRAGPPIRPLLFVCGPPRSGTTLVSQVLISHLPVAYFNNLTSLFPRAPLTANAVLGRRIKRPPADFHSYYGRSRRLAGSNDALYLWDRWLGIDRSRIPAALQPGRRGEMVQFFGALESLTGRPLVAKNNNLNAVAHLVAEALPTASFLCLDRDPGFLAQSLLRARREIHGDEATPYGFHDPGPSAGSPIESVCRQVAFHRGLMRRQQETLGSRFRVVSYEQFCRNPEETVRMAAGAMLGLPGPDRPIASFDAANRVRVDATEFSEIEATLDRLGVARTPVSA